MCRCEFWLTGEEASVAFKDVVFLRLRLQHCRYDTNLGGHILYFLAHAVHPDPGLWYGRETKAVLMALAGPLTYLFARRLGLGFVASVFSGLCIFLFPTEDLSSRSRTSNPGSRSPAA